MGFWQRLAAFLYDPPWDPAPGRLGRARRAIERGQRLFEASLPRLSTEQLWAQLRQSHAVASRPSVVPAWEALQAHAAAGRWGQALDLLTTNPLNEGFYGPGVARHFDYDRHYRALIIELRARALR